MSCLASTKNSYEEQKTLTKIKTQTEIHSYSQRYLGKAQTDSHLGKFIFIFVAEFALDVDFCAQLQLNKHVQVSNLFFFFLRSRIDRPVTPLSLASVNLFLAPERRPISTRTLRHCLLTTLLRTLTTPAITASTTPRPRTLIRRPLLVC